MESRYLLSNRSVRYLADNSSGSVQSLNYPLWAPANTAFTTELRWDVVRGDNCWTTTGIIQSRGATLGETESGGEDRWTRPPLPGLLHHNRGKHWNWPSVLTPPQLSQDPYSFSHENISGDLSSSPTSMKWTICCSSLSNESQSNTFHSFLNVLRIHQFSNQVKKII